MTRAWDKVSLTGIEPMTSGTRGGRSMDSKVYELMDSKVFLTEFICDRRPA